jgi:UDP-N-acetyl-D-glucosamine dehydrogenase
MSFATTVQQQPGPQRTGFDQRVKAQTAVIGVVGLGYVGLPLALAYAQKGFRVRGVDVDPVKAEAVSQGRSYLKDISAQDMADVVMNERLSAETSYASLQHADAIFMCVPTPCTRNKAPDTSCIESASRGVAHYLQPDQMVILRSTSYPGTTEELVKPALEKEGLEVGRDFYLAFAPERVDPGNPRYTIRNTPVVVGGCDPESTRRAVLVLDQVVDRVVAVSSPAAAEMTKLLENVYRNVNIALVNQVAMFCDRMGLDVWEIVEAAATKPYGFESFRPGPGVGGHCIPVDPYYLAWKAREYDFHMDFIELAARVNEEMPYYVATKVSLCLNGSSKFPGAPRILVFGVAFKRDVEDYRDSPALKIMELLHKQGAVVAYHDPYVPSLPFHEKILQSEKLTPEVLRSYDCILITTDHSCVDYSSVVRHAQRVFDTRNATVSVKDCREKIIRL